VAPSLPDFYNAAIEGIEIGLGTGSGGTTAFSGARVIVEDIATHPYWARYKELAASAGLVSCWSQAIRSSSGQVLGTFAIYHREANTPVESDIYLIDQSARLASIAIEKSIATEKLRDSEALYRLLTEDVSDVVWKTDRNLRVTYISPADERLRGYSADEVIGHHVFEMFTEAGVAAVTEMIQKGPNAEQRGAQSGFVTFEAQHRCRDGRLLWGEVLSKPERDAHGTIIGYHGITREITERRQLEDLRCEFLVALTSYQEKAPALPVNTHSRVFSH
jgi:PAS domain S-box-containing protein